MLLNLRIFIERKERIFCEAIEREHNLHREKEAKRRDRYHLEDREKLQETCRDQS